MIAEDIKNSIREALYAHNSSIIFHFEEVKHTGFPYAILSLKDFKIEPAVQYTRQRCEFVFELGYQKSEDNKIIELLEAQTLLKDALLPALNIKDKKVTLDDVSFSVQDKKLLMKFKLVLYTVEQDLTESMQTLDITYKGE